MDAIKATWRRAGAERLFISQLFRTRMLVLVTCECGIIRGRGNTIRYGKRPRGVEGLAVKFRLKTFMRHIGSAFPVVAINPLTDNAEKSQRGE